MISFSCFLFLQNLYISDPYQAVDFIKFMVPKLRRVPRSLKKVLRAPWQTFRELQESKYGSNGNTMRPARLHGKNFRDSCSATRFLRILSHKHVNVIGFIHVTSKSLVLLLKCTSVED